jgi:hypothetical protein
VGTVTRLRFSDHNQVGFHQTLRPFLLLLQSSLLQDTLLGLWVELGVHLSVNGNSPGFCWMLVLSMT